ncbi:MAG TPA: PQQ-binding-like beta-propeller repeat protein, partial [Flavisolibacter sp.]|nr:PQQ-binding-like beta-propeller repeat protein [Flavisolibacter sp.]
MKPFFRISLLPFLLLLTAHYTSSAQNNPCGVIAAINPGNDTIVTQGTIIHLTSVSTNATSFRFISNGIAYPLNMAPNLTFIVGLHTIKLVAYNGSCTDTATLYIFQPGAQPADRTNIQSLYGLPYINQNASSIDAMPSGGYILSGSIQDNYFYRYPDKGLLIKIKESGCIEWTRFVEGRGFNHGKIYGAKVTFDGGVVIAGQDHQLTSYVMKLDAGGNTIWSKTYSSVNGTNGFTRWAIEAMPDGGVVLTGAYSNVVGLALLRLDASGNIIWNRLLNSQIFGSNWMRSVAVDGNDLFVAGYLPNIANTATQSGSVVIKLDYSSGQVQWTKKYKVEYGDVAIHDIHIVAGNELLINTKGGGLDGTKLLNTYFFTDRSSGTVKRAKRLLSGTIPMSLYTTTMIPLSNNKFYVLATGTQTLSLQPGFAHHSLVMKMDSDSTIQWVRHYGSYGKGRLFYATKGPQESFVALGDEVGQSIPAYSLSNKLMFRRIDSSGSSEVTTCFMYDSPVQVEPIQIIESPFTWLTDSIMNLHSYP